MSRYSIVIKYIFIAVLLPMFYGCSDEVTEQEKLGQMPLSEKPTLSFTLHNAHWLPNKPITIEVKRDVKSDTNRNDYSCSIIAVRETKSVKETFSMLVLDSLFKTDNIYDLTTIMCAWNMFTKIIIHRPHMY
jgi:hypothetical protein